MCVIVCVLVCTCVVVSVAVCRPGPVLVEAQAVGRDGGWAVVAQRGRTTGAAVHILHVHTTVTAGQVVLTHPAQRAHTHTHTSTHRSDSFIHVRISARDTNWQRAIKNLASLDYSSWLKHTHTLTHKLTLRGSERCYVTVLAYVTHTSAAFLLN